eukprot:3418791-Pyramimonas_sp.AAC.1
MLDPHHRRLSWAFRGAALPCSSPLHACGALAAGFFACRDAYDERGLVCLLAGPRDGGLRAARRRLASRADAYDERGL